MILQFVYLQFSHLKIIIIQLLLKQKNPKF